MGRREEPRGGSGREVDGLKVGHATLALGRPGRSVRASLRIVGVLGPEVRTPWGGRLDRYVETDRGFPRGFSGGPLVDLEGRALGVNTSGLARGAPMALPASVVDNVVTELLTHGHMRRGYVGVALHPVELGATAAERLRLERAAGLLVMSVADGSPADSDGLMVGDVLLTANGTPLRHPTSFLDTLWTLGERKPIAFELVRGGEIKTVAVTPVDRPTAA